MAVVTLLAGALGSIFSLRAAPPPQVESQKEAPASEPGILPTSNLFDLPPIVTNLGAPSDTWVRLEASMVFDSKVVQHPEVLGGEIADDLLAYLRTVTLAQIQGPVGLQNLRQDLNERVSIRSGGKIKELVLRTLVVQ